MAMILSDFCKEYISQFNYRIINDTSSPLIYNQLLFYDPECPIYPSGTLLVTSASKLPHDALPQSDKALTIFCIADSEFPSVYLENGRLNLVEISNDVNPFQLYNALASSINDRLTTHDDFITFLNSGSRSNTMQELVNNVANVLHCPVAFLSEQLKLISLCSNYSESHPYWLSLKEKKQYTMPFSITNILTDGKLIRSLPTESNENLKSECFFPIYSDNDAKLIIGYIYWIFVPDSRMNQKFVFVNSISHVISWYFWRYASIPHQDTDLTFMIYQLLNGIDDRETQTSARLKQINSKLKDSVYMVVVDTAASSNKLLTWNSIKSEFHDILPICNIINYNANVLLFLPKDSISEGRWEQLTRILEHLDCYAGISGPFRNYDRFIVNHYTRATHAAAMARTLNARQRYIHYNRVALNDFVFNKPDDTTLFRLIDPQLLQLADHDEKYNTEYVHTLWTYWNSGRSIHHTAREMCIHKNTLYYRLSRISDFLGYNLDNTGIFLELSISMVIMEFLGIIPKFQTNFIADDLLAFLKSNVDS